MILLLDAFEGLNVYGELADVYSEVEVESVKMKKEDVFIHAVSKRLISYLNRKKMESLINQQLFSHLTHSAPLTNKVNLNIKFNLSARFTLDKLMPIYYESLLEELKDHSVLDYNLFKTAKKTIHGNVLTIECEDCLIYRKRESTVREVLERNFIKQCDMDVEIRFRYHEVVKKLEKEGNAYTFVTRDAENTRRNQAPNEGRMVRDKKEAGVQKGPVKNFRRRKKDPEVVFGSECEGTPLHIADVQEEIGEVVVCGKVIRYDEIELKNGKKMIVLKITDHTDSITVKFFPNAEEYERVKEHVQNDCFIKVKAKALMDDFDKEITLKSVVGVKPIEDFLQKRKDDASEKRVELHAHTFMSEMDGFADPKKLIDRARAWGHEAIAITDHGVVQAFPSVMKAIKKEDDFKAIYGMEAYLVDDLSLIAEHEKGESLKGDFVVFDIETTGFDKKNDQIIEIGAVKVGNGAVRDTYHSFVNPLVPIPDGISRLTNIHDDMVKDAPTINEVLTEFLEFCGDCPLVAHNASFDVGFIRKKAEDMGKGIDCTVVDTLSMARVLLPELSKYKLSSVARALRISLEHHHRAVDDARATAEVFIRFLQMLEEKGIHDLSELNAFGKVSKDAIKKMPMYHAIILAQNEIGRVNLYRLVSLSHVDYFGRKPRIPKSVLRKNREGLLIGSACEAGELFHALLRNRSEEEVRELVMFYDYLEIQPLGNNYFMLDHDRYPVRSKEDLMDLNRKIVDLGERYDKPVVATGDVHFIDPEDEAYRRIIMKGKGFEDADDQAPLYFKTTKEMLHEFEYLGEEKAYEVVVTNTNRIADRIERISPVRPDKCPPVIENSDKELKEICYAKAHAMYGPNLPQLVRDRLEHELESIIGNGFAVMYVIAQKLVSKSNEDGYLVGSRGSVGSSFVATMSGITEVNPLPAHYYCDGCYYSDFESEEVKSHSGSAGYDLPDKPCPNCGKPLKKEGHDIPFETFLGFNGDKEPDIDLNFSGEYQSKAHEYVDEIFGKEYTFRAGTVGTMAEKTAYGFIMKYFEEQGVKKRRAEIDRLVKGCVGVKRTTGQHPGGIIVLPYGEDVHSFTPVQKPANDMNTKTVTTHFDYHSIEHNLLKLDILGHDDPTMIRMLEDLTGVDAKSVSFDEPKVLSLFLHTKALGVEPEDLDGCDLGCLGIPEFGTEFVMQMLKSTKPKTFSDLVRISGLSHGTDVWLNNAQYYIQNGDCTLSTAICTRDDIMTYLIHMGVKDGLAFNIMEDVRRGKGLTSDYEEAMREAGVPEWYMESCNKIKYMFPKAHAAAYVMMAFRIAYFKVYYPLAYYAAYFSIRATAFDYSIMCGGRDALEKHVREYKKRTGQLTKKEQDLLKDAKIVQEMYARGFEFTPIDIYRAKAKRFLIVDGKLMPSLNTIEGLGEKAAEAVEEEAVKTRFSSQDDFKNRCKVSVTVLESMDALGLFGDLPKSEQMSILDFL